MSLKAKKASESFSILTEFVLPNDTNTLGNLMGGRLLHWMDIAAAIAEKADLTKDQANRVLNAVLEEITGALNRKDSVTLVGFGTFVQRHRGARTGKNPQTGAPVTIKASNTVAFKPGKALKDSVN